MGTSRIFVFSVLFLTTQWLILFSLEAPFNPLDQTGNTINLLNIAPPPAPDFDSSPFGFISNTVEAASYAIAITVYGIRMLISLFTFPAVLIGRVLSFNGKYPFMLIINGTVILFLAYSLITRLSGGD